MIFLENVHTEFTVPVDSDEDRYFTLNLSAMPGDRINGNAFLDIPTKYLYSLSIERRVRTAPLVDSNLPVVSGIAYISRDEIKELKKDPYKFCIENGIIEGNEETETEIVNSEEDKNDIHKEIP